VDRVQALEIIQCLKEEQQILNIIEKSEYDRDVCWVGISLLKLDQKSEEELISIMERTFYNRYFCWIGISFLKSADLILRVLRESEDNQLIYDAGIRLLRLEEKSTEELTDIMRKSEYNWNICQPILSIIKSRNDQPT
jgi:hypothetical protein